MKAGSNLASETLHRGFQLGRTLERDIPTLVLDQPPAEPISQCLQAFAVFAELALVGIFQGSARPRMRRSASPGRFRRTRPSNGKSTSVGSATASNTPSLQAWANGVRRASQSSTGS